MTLKQLLEEKDFEELNYFDFLKCDEWKSKRVEILKRDNFKCTKCGNTPTIRTFSGSTVVNLFKDGKPNPENISVNLQVHHTLYVFNQMPWNYDNEELETLCNFCHEELHNNEEIIVWDEHKLNKLKYGRCDRCSGKGYIKEYKHVSNGICFKCRGFGYEKPLITKKPEIDDDVQPF